jgi:PPOX class probable F420-dependent enzyme
MELDLALSFARTRSHGVLTTIRRDGRPQLSNVFYVSTEHAFEVSVTATRAKTKNLSRDSRAGLYVPGEDFWNYVVLDGTVALLPSARDVDDDTVERLVDYYRRGAGEHPDWDEYRATMVAEERLLVVLTPTSAYGQVSR